MAVVVVVVVVVVVGGVVVVDGGVSAAAVMMRASNCTAQTSNTAPAVGEVVAAVDGSDAIALAYPNPSKRATDSTSFGSLTIVMPAARQRANSTVSLSSWEHSNRNSAFASANEMEMLPDDRDTAALVDDGCSSDSVDRRVSVFAKYESILW